MRTRGWDAGSLRTRQREGDADYHFRLNLNGATLGKGPVGSPTGQDFQWTWMPVEPTHGRLLGRSRPWVGCCQAEPTMGRLYGALVPQSACRRRKAGMSR